VTPSSHTRRLAISMTKKMYSRPSSTVSTWVKSQARMLPA
jgi:hypothetical protein